MRKNKKIDFSIVIPTYNEESKKDDMIEHFDSIKQYFKGKRDSYEVIIVLDGPTDKSPKIVKDYIKSNKQFRAIDRKNNRGKGFTVREGLMAAKGEVRLFTDTDGATPIKMLDRFLPKFKKGADVVIASRAIDRRQVKVHQPKWKEALGRVGNLLIQAGTGLWGVKDTQCGFKAMKKEAAMDIIPRMKIDRWGFDFELLMIGKKLGYKIEAVPVEWIDKGDSLVGISGYFSTFKDLARVKWNMICGQYELNKKVDDLSKNKNAN